VFFLSVTGPTASRKEVKIKSKARVMSNINILNSISEADKAKLAALLLGGAETAKPEAASGFKPKNDDWRSGEATYPQKMRILSYLDGSPKVKARYIDPEGVALRKYWEDDTDLTFGELFTVEDREGKRHFPVLWTGLNAGEASDIRQLLEALPAKPEAEQPKAKSPKAKSPKAKAAGGFKPKASEAPSQNFGEAEARFQKIEALLLQLAEGQFRQEPAKPVAATGHSKKPAKPVADPVPAKPEIVKLAEGQIVEWQGKLVELTVQANGRIGQRSVG
jgi:hypothetical protein